MHDLVKFLLGLVVTVVIPMAIILGIYFDFLPETLAVIIATGAVVLSAIYIVGGNLLMMYQDIKTGRYSKEKYRG